MKFVFVLVDSELMAEAAVSYRLKRALLPKEREVVG